jgi:hypothetical protein
VTADPTASTRAGGRRRGWAAMSAIARVLDPGLSTSAQDATYNVNRKGM